MIYPRFQGLVCLRFDVCRMLESPYCVYVTATLHKLAAAHLLAPERQIDYCTPVKTVAYNKFNN